jgi:anti-sigma B factor antagonist
MASNGGQSFGVRWEVTREAGLVTVAILGELDLASVEPLQHDLAALVEAEPVIVLDLAGLDFLDSTGLRMLGQLQRAAVEKTVRFLIGRPSAAVIRVMEVAGLLDYFDFVEGGPPGNNG